MRARRRAPSAWASCAARVPAPHFGGPRRSLGVLAQARRGALLAAAERIRRRRSTSSRCAACDLGSPPRWNRDPKTGIEAPLVFGKTLDYRDPDVVGDIKYLWEPNRHLQLVTLAQAYALTGKAKYFEELAEQLDSWFVACPYGWDRTGRARSRPRCASSTGRSPGSCSAARAAGSSSRRAMRRLRRVGCARCTSTREFVRGWFSLHSSANNHLIGEAAGLFIAGVTWPHWKRAALWAETGKRMLEREALAQNAPDGVNHEQAVWYQHFVLDFLCSACSPAAQTAGGSRPSTRRASNRCSTISPRSWTRAATCRSSAMPTTAASARLAQGEGFCPYKSLLATGAILFGRGDFKLKAGALDDKTRALDRSRRGRGVRALDAKKTRLPLRRTFPQGGCYVLGCDFDTPAEIRLVADAGPLGYRSIAAHGHADALSFTLSAAGRELLIDPGTYAYHTRGAWRQYFRGTSAHNTVRIDGLDQSVQGGNFLWLEKANAACSVWLSSAEKDCFEGWHDGYRRLPDPVKHRRLIELDKRARRIVVEDTLEMAEDHEVELFFHCHEESRVAAVDGGFVVRRSEVSLRITLPRIPGARLDLVTGSLAPMSGWVSRAFDCRQPAPTIAWRARLTGRSVLCTEMLVGLR